MSKKPYEAPGNCSGCAKALPKREYMQCSNCMARYDLECANVSSKRFYSFFGAGSESKWRCPECVSKQPKTGNSDTPVRSCTALPHTPNDGYLNVTQRKKSNNEQGESLVEDEDMGYSGKDFKLLLIELRSVRQEICFMHSTMTDLHATIKEQNTRIAGLETRVNMLEASVNENKCTDVTELENRISQLRLDIQDRDQQMLDNDVEISSLPEMPNENPTHVFLTVANKLGLNLEARDVVTAERVGPPRAAVEGAPPPRPRPLVARLALHASRTALLQAARVRRRLTTEGMGLSGAITPLYVNERLTRDNRQLFQKAREAGKRLKWRFVWTRDGKIFARRDQGETVHRLRTDADFDRVFGANPVRASSPHTH